MMMAEEEDDNDEATTTHRYNGFMGNNNNNNNNNNNDDDAQMSRPSFSHHRVAVTNSRFKNKKKKKKNVSMIMISFAIVTWLIWSWSHFSIVMNSTTGTMRSIPDKQQRHWGTSSFVRDGDEKNISSSSLLSTLNQTNSTAQQPQRPGQGTTNPNKKRRKRRNKGKINKKPDVFISPGPIYYNVYVPEQKKNSKLVSSIVKQQIADKNEFDPNSTLLYTLISSQKKDATAVETVFQTKCPQTCQQRGETLSVGDEVDTLQALWDYCNDSNNVPSSIYNDTLVSYIHDKGSFHNNKNNERARILGTRSTLICRHQMLSKPRICNICTSVFQIIPQLHGSANMWTARCSYIKELHSPHLYPQLLQAMYDNTLNHTIKRYSEEYRCLRPRHQDANRIGAGRYALERWAFSHPNVRPCDNMRGGGGKDYSADEYKSGNWTPGDIKQAPRYPAHAIGLNNFKTSFDRLEGRLFEWNYLYNQRPANTSWVWTWYSKDGGYDKGTEGALAICQKDTMPPSTEAETAEEAIVV